MADSSPRRSTSARTPALKFRPTMTWADAELYEDSGYIRMHDLVYSLDAAEKHLGSLGYLDGTCEIPIRNKLVKHAARAYLRPLSAVAAASRFAPRGRRHCLFRRMLDPLYDAVRCLMEVICPQAYVDSEEETKREVRRRMTQ